MAAAQHILAVINDKHNIQLRSRSFPVSGSVRFELNNWLHSRSESFVCVCVRLTFSFFPLFVIFLYVNVCLFLKYEIYIREWAKVASNDECID